MKRKGKRLLSWVLTLAMVVGLMPGMSLTAYAAEQKVTFTAGGTENGITVSPTFYKFEAFFVNNNGNKVSISSSNYNITKLVLTDKKLYSGQWGDSYLGASAGNVSFSGDTMTVTGINAKTVTIQGNNSKYATISSIDVYYDVPDGYSVTINPGSNMTKTDGSGAASQTGLSGAMTDVVYTADAGYYFPTDYSVAEVNGITVTRDSYTQITVSGTPTANATITLTAPTQKTTPDAPTTAATTDCTTADNNDGKLTGVTTAMEYKKSDVESWLPGSENGEIAGLVPGTYYVRVKATDTANASANQELTIAGYTAPTHTHAWATAWSNDVTYHWHACTGEGATDACLNETAAAKAAHTYGDTGDARFTCTVCEYVDTTKQAAAVLADAKTTATATVNGVNSDDYIAADRQTVTNAKTTALNAINTATTEAEVTTALTNFNNAIAGCTTQAAADLATAKTNATATVNGVDANDYIEADRQTVADAKTTALNAINSATTEAEVTTALTNFNNAIAGCTTQIVADVITQVMNEVSAKTGSDVVYSGNPIQLINTPTTSLPNGYTMKYAVTTENTAPADNLYTTSIPTGTNAGIYYVWYKVKGDANHNDTEPQSLTVIIRNPTPSGGGTTPATITIPVSGEGKDAETVNVTVQVTGATATVTSADVDKVLEAKDVGNVTVDVSGLNNSVDEVVLPAEMVKKVADAVSDKGNDASGLEINLPSGTVILDAKTVAAIAEQSNSKDLKLHLNKVSETTLNSAQQSTVKVLNTLVVLDAYVTADGKRISDFNGGTATFSVPVKLGDGQTAAGVTAYFVAENGEKTEIPCTYDGKNATGTVTHFSNYVVAYDTEKAKKAEESAKQIEDTVKDLDALPAAADVKPEDKEAIEKARAAYDALTDEQKKKVDPATLKKLTDAEAALKAAEPEPTPEPGKVSYDDLTEAEKKQADEIASALSVDKDTAAAMVKTAQELGVSLDTVKLSGDALAKLDVDSSDPKGTDFGKLTAQATKRTNTALTLKWTKQKKADGYLIYGNKCGKGNKMKLVKTIKKNSTVKWTQKKLKKGTYYKYMVVAYKNVNGEKMPIAASVVIHVPTKSGKVTVAKSLTVKQGKKVVSKLTVKKGKSVTVKVTENKEEKKLKIKTHRKVKFESSDPKIATVNAKGKITGKKKGKATVWAYAQNGIFKAVKVTVK